MPLHIYAPDGKGWKWEDGMMKADHQHERATIQELKCDCGYTAESPTSKHHMDCNVYKRIIPRESVKYYPENDVKSPDHYAYGGIETIDYIKAKLTPEQYTGYLWGNVLKYISRFDKKEGIKDLKKAAVYIEWLVDAYEKRLIFPHKVVE